MFGYASLLLVYGKVQTQLNYLLNFWEYSRDLFVIPNSDNRSFFFTFNASGHYAVVFPSTVLFYPRPRSDSQNSVDAPRSQAPSSPQTT